jgi:hypothetical protein
VNRERIALPRISAELCPRKDLVQASCLVE